MLLVRIFSWLDLAMPNLRSTNPTRPFLGVLYPLEHLWKTLTACLAAETTALQCSKCYGSREYDEMRVAQFQYLGNKDDLAPHLAAAYR